MNEILVIYKLDVLETTKHPYLKDRFVQCRSRIIVRDQACPCAEISAINEKEKINDYPIGKLFIVTAVILKLKWRKHKTYKQSSQETGGNYDIPNEWQSPPKESGQEIFPF